MREKSETFMLLHPGDETRKNLYNENINHRCSTKQEKSPLMVALTSTTASLARYFMQEAKKVSYPCL